MKKLKVRFCEWNMEREGSRPVKEWFEANHRDIADVETTRCMGNCPTCNQGPYCAINDFLFQKKTPEALIEFLDDLLTKLRKGLEERQKEMQHAQRQQQQQ